MILKLRAFPIILLSITLAACGSDSRPMPVDSGEDRRLTDGSDYERPPTGDVGVDSAAKWTLTDGGECIGPSWPPVYTACTLDEHPCGGQSVCRSCNSGLGLWAIMPVWSCVCASATVNGSTGLYWQCPSVPVCQLGPGTFVDSQCTQPAVIDGGIDQAAPLDVTMDRGGDLEIDSVIDGVADRPADLALDIVSLDGPDEGGTYDGGPCPAGQVLRYQSPGCGADAKPVCGSSDQDACYRAVCSCKGVTISRCDYAPEPFAFFGTCDVSDGGNRG
jgi:hypothetical protein